MTRARRWPDRATRREAIQQGILDDTMCAVDIYALDDWEIFGDPAPGDTEPDRDVTKRHPRRTA